MSLMLELGVIPVSRLTRRLTDTPQDFLVEPGEVSVPAIVSDVLIAAGGEPLGAVAAPPFASEQPAQRNRLRLVLVASWLLADEQLLALRRAERVHTFLTAVVPRLAGLVDAGRFVTDPDRREELARLAMRALGMQPAEETPAQSEDRLSTVDSVRRHEVLVAAREAEERANAVRKAMEEKRAKEAAAHHSQV